MARYVLILSILIGLAAAFLGWKTKEQAEQLQTALKDARQSLTTSKASQKKAEDASKAAQESLTETQGKLKQSETDATNAKGEASNAKEALAKEQASGKENADKLAAVEAQFADLKVRLGDIKIEEIGPRMNALADSAKKAESERDEAKTVADTYKKQADEATAQLSSKDRTILEYKQGYVRNGLTGKVLAFNPGWNFVVMSLGDKQGIKVGAQMVVTRGGAMVGKVKITSVEPNQSIGDVLPGSIARGESVQPGDSVVFQGTR